MNFQFIIKTSYWCPNHIRPQYISTLTDKLVSFIKSAEKDFHFYFKLSRFIYYQKDHVPSLSSGGYFHT